MLVPVVRPPKALWSPIQPTGPIIRQISFSKPTFIHAYNEVEQALLWPYGSQEGTYVLARSTLWGHWTPLKTPLVFPWTSNTVSDFAIFVSAWSFFGISIESLATLRFCSPAQGPLFDSQTHARTGCLLTGHHDPTTSGWTAYRWTSRRARRFPLRPIPTR